MPICKEAGCSRQVASGSEYCQICGSAHTNAPKSLAENTALVQQQATTQRPQSPAYGLLGQGFNPKVKFPNPDVHQYPTTPSEHFAGCTGWSVFLGGLVVAAVLLIGLMSFIDKV